MEQLPSNSHSQKREPAEEPKKIEKVVQGEVTTRKRPFFKRISDALIANRADTVGEFVLWDIIVPGTKNVIADMTTSFVERMMFGESVPRGRASAAHSRGTGSYGGQQDRIAYNRIGNPVPSGPSMSHRGRARHDFQEILIPTRLEAEEVLDQMFKRVVEYNAVTVADLYELCGITPNYTDDKYGWTDIRGSGILRVRDGFVLDLPRPEPLD